MKFISHRGNIEGKITDLENNPTYIDKALSIGYDVEVDLWFNDGDLYLGHDTPEHKTNLSYLNNNKLWIHCKNIPALEFLLKSNIAADFFFHNSDDVTLTKNGLLWTYPGKQLTHLSICVLPEWITSPNIEISHGICSDVIKKYKLQ